ncbi:WcbI family polysaccharide biosynthesis putative acetyltransferase [Halocynthiibacter styelae]|uniref:Polysaccharide biosynthesis enzyme WcbI domain-containing protein n=1 Tax=Halocynthiibacter styelae TaxID=2761955 RepID=A0A8J7IQ34_9RHOB|nr:WcbI family polysaccharide biosynthesis putative acetyltransferase [Paenihalocynthiibacter styelae]MBI1495076.1 hypothetical protein [Paenihalocynthiibacter styelae]
MINVLIVSDCATTAFLDYIRALHPGCRVRCIVTARLNDWHEIRGDAFISAVAATDILICLPNTLTRLKGYLPEASATVDALVEKGVSTHNPDILLQLDGITSHQGMQVIEIPRFRYLGPRVDCFWMPKLTSPLGRGALHSKIAVSAWMLKKNASDTLKLFNAQHFENTGYFEQYEQERVKLFDTYADSGIDISGVHADWMRQGDFQYSPNHPKAEVLVDIMHIAANASGHFPVISEGEYANYRQNVPDYMADGLIWPVYPELADYWGLSSYQQRWRTGKRDGGEYFELEDMIKRTFASLDSFQDSEEKVRKYLGAEDVWHWFGEEAC